MLPALLLLLSPCWQPLANLKRENALTPHTVGVCLELSLKARSFAVEPHQAVALAYRESRLRRDQTRSCGADGPLQRIERYWPGDPVEAGLRAMAYYQRRHPQNWFCHYTGRGPKCKTPPKFVVKIAAARGTSRRTAR